MKSILFLTLLCCTTWLTQNGFAAAKKGSKKPEARVIVSKNADHILRMEPGNANRKASILTFKFDSAKQTFANSGRIQLRNPVQPELMFITDNGRYVVTLDDLHKVGVTENAVVIYDLQNNMSKAFSLEEFMPQKTIKEIPWTMGMRIWRSGWATLDNEALKLYPSGITQGLKPYPHVIVDIAHMEVYVGSRK